MENLLLISEIAQELEQHGNAARMKKLIFATWRKCWENDLSTINKFPLTNILQELVNSYPTPEQLRIAIINIADTLNKKEEYRVIAEIILGKLRKLYGNQSEEPMTQMVYQAVAIFSEDAAKETISEAMPNDNPVSTPVNSNTLGANSGANLEIDKDYDAFAVRLAVMKYSNPLRAKILLFCLVDEQSSFNQSGWLKLRSRPLDELLVEVFQKFANLEQLEYQLHATARNLQEPDEHAQAAEAIVKAMKPFYKDKNKDKIRDQSTSSSATYSEQDRIFSNTKEESTNQFSVNNRN